MVLSSEEHGTFLGGCQWNEHLGLDASLWTTVLHMPPCGKYMYTSLGSEHDNTEGGGLEFFWNKYFCVVEINMLSTKQCEINLMWILKWISCCKKKIKLSITFVKKKKMARHKTPRPLEIWLWPPYSRHIMQTITESPQSCQFLLLLLFLRWWWWSIKTVYFFLFNSPEKAQVSRLPVTIITATPNGSKFSFGDEYNKSTMFDGQRMTTISVFNWYVGTSCI